MNVPGLGEVTKDDRFGCYYSQPIKIAVLGGKDCRIVLEGYDEDQNKDEYHVAISNFLASSPAVLREAEPYIYQYYQDIGSYFSPSDEFVSIGSPAEIWSHIRLGDEPMVSRRGYGTKESISPSNATVIGNQNTDYQLFSKTVTRFVRLGHTMGTSPILMRSLTRVWKMSFIAAWHNKSVNRTPKSHAFGCPSLRSGAGYVQR